MRRVVIIICRVVAICMAFVMLSCMEFATTSASASQVTTQSADTTVGSNDELDAYVGSGGLILPKTFDGGPSVRQQVADCLTCIWKYSIYCAQDATVACAHAVTTCRSGYVRYRVRFGYAMDNLSTIGSVCWGHQAPLTRRVVIARIHQDALRRVPRLNPGYVPPGGSLVGVPIIVWSGQPSTFEPRPMYLSGLRITVTARALWRWTWGDISAQWTASPGSRSALTGLRHAYGRAGNYHVEVKTVWTAKYAISGLGGYTLSDQPIHQVHNLNVKVQDDRARLILH